MRAQTSRTATLDLISRHAYRRSVRSRGRQLLAAAVILAVVTSCRQTKREEPPVTAPSSITVTSSDLSAGEAIPPRFTCDGENISPALAWHGVPGGAAGLALVVDDPDAPRGTFTHWVVANIPTSVTGVATGQTPDGQQVRNDAGRAQYYGPCPPSGVHHYRFKIYALSAMLADADLRSLSHALGAIRNNAIAQGEIVATYRR